MSFVKHFLSMLFYSKVRTRSEFRTIAKRVRTELDTLEAE